MHGLQEGAYPPLRRGAWFSPSAQIEYETRIAYRFPPETGWCGLAPIQELLNFTQKIHLVFLIPPVRLGGPSTPNAIPTCLGIFL